MNKVTLQFFLFVTVLLVSLAASAARYEVVEVQNGGTLSGKVVFSGADPAPQSYTIDGNTDVCGNSQEIDYVKVNNGALTDVVVYLDKVPAGKAFSDEEAEIDQVGCKFLPFFSVMINGQDLKVHNSDAVAHNVHTFELIGASKRTAFNVNQPDQGSVLTKRVKLRRGNAMKLECDQHAFMHGFIFVAKNPYYTLVAEDGSFTIDNIPPGSYTLRAWHATLVDQEAMVEIISSGTAVHNFEFQGE
ncbi:MAG: DUF2012 domain-containing protein [Xanthomonadales bacterium]